jgi:hypothetical protein
VDTRNGIAELRRGTEPESSWLQIANRDVLLVESMIDLRYISATPDDSSLALRRVGCHWDSRGVTLSCLKYW